MDGKVRFLGYLLIIVLCVYTSTKKKQQTRYSEVHHLNSSQIQGIKKALLLNSDYQIMSLFLPNQLSNITINDDSTITIFVPADTGVIFDPQVDIRNQFIRSKVEKEDFVSGKINTRTKFTTYFPENYFKFSGLVAVTGPRSGESRPSINGVLIRDWNMYNDGRVIVHGVDKFFHTHWVQQRTLFGSRWDPSINANVEYVDPELQEWLDDHPEWFDRSYFMPKY